MKLSLLKYNRHFLNVFNLVIDARDNGYNTPCHWAVYNNQPKALRILLDSRADMTILNHAKMAPIHVACYENKPDIIEVRETHYDC